MRFSQPSHYRRIAIAILLGSSASAALAQAQTQVAEADASAEAQPAPEAADQNEPAPAQDAAAPTAQAQNANIVVTGSRIARTDYTAESPTVTVGRDVIQESGSPTFDVVLNQLPQLTASAGAQTPQANGASRGLGRASANLRGLGAQRTLVLIDGRRAQPSDANNVVDLNTIPTTLVSSVEIITGGASAAYGSDAIAGVINFRLNRTFQGLRLDGDVGITDKGDGFNTNLAITAGTSFADGRGHLIGAASYFHRDLISRRARRFFDGTLGSSQGPVGIYRPGSNSPSQAALNSLFNGRYGVTGTVSRTADLSVNADNTLYTQIGGINFRPFTPYFFNPIQNEVQALSDPVLQVPLDRYSAFARVGFDFSDAFKPYIQGSYVTYTATQRLPGTIVTLGTITMPVTNPFVPADLRTLLASRASPNAPFTLRLRLNKLGDQEFEQRYRIFQVATGATGRIGIGDVSYDAFASFGRTNSRISADNYVNATNYQAVLNAPDGGNSLCAGGLNPFDLNQVLSQACRDFLSETDASRERFTQYNADLTFQGSLFNLWDGPVRFALGAEYRRNSYAVRPDINLQNGQAIGGQAGANNQLPTQGTQDVREVFGELLIPVLRDRPFFQDLSLDLAYRYSDYKYGGGVSTYRAGVEWRVAEPLMLRGGYARAIRAPSLGDLFAPGSTVAGLIGQPTAGGGDPCDVRFSGRNATNTAQIRTLCIATGVPAASADTFNASGGIRISQGGNLDLVPERSDSYTIGAVFRSSFLPPALSHITASVDFYNIRISNALGVTPATTTLVSCYNINGLNPNYSPDSPFCRAISRDPNGFIDIVQQKALNLLRFETAGIDTQVDWTIRAEDLGLSPAYGSLDLNVILSYVQKYNIQPSVIEAVQNFSGTIGNATIDPEGIAHPRWKAFASASYRFGIFEVGARYRYIAGMRNVSPANLLYPTVPSRNYWDFNLAIRPTEAFELRAGVINAFDTQPVIYQALGTTDASTYDLVGRRFYVGATVRF